MQARGGGVRDVEVRILPRASREGDMVITHLLVDTRDAMGANLVNSMCEGVASLLEKLDYQAFVEMLIVPRYSIALGIRRIENKKRTDPAIVKIDSERKVIKQEIDAMLEKLANGEKIDHKKLKELRNKYNELRNKSLELKKPYNEKMKPLRKALRRADGVIEQILMKHYNIQPIEDIKNIPPYLKE